MTQIKRFKAGNLAMVKDPSSDEAVYGTIVSRTGGEAILLNVATKEEETHLVECFFKTTEDDLQAYLDQEIENDEDSDESQTKMPTTLAKYKAGYQVTIAASGRKSLSTTDDVADALQMKTSEEVTKAGEILLGFAPGELAAKYAHLNAGSRRMNVGNRIRAAVKRGDITIADIILAL